MKDLIDQRTIEGLRHYGDDATQRYYQLLRDGEFKSTRCNACGETAYPPREFCPQCHCQVVSWVDLPREGTLYAFTTQDRAFRFIEPEVIGLVELDGVGRILTHVKGTMADLTIGQRVTFALHTISEQLVVPSFESL
jgi:hypothetical protein